MKLIRPGYEILTPLSYDMVTDAERIGRTCYQSQDKITVDSAEGFVKRLISRGHEAMIEHNRITVKFICDRGVSHELVRHRLASFGQESTRYVPNTEDISFILPCWVSELHLGAHTYQTVERSMDDLQGNGNFSTEVLNQLVFLKSLCEAEFSYHTLLAHGWQPQQARAVLPNALKTEIVVTANVREWRTIFKLRADKAAHPQMRQLMYPLLEELKNSAIGVFFHDLPSER